jgi:hypothetical protein
MGSNSTIAGRWVRMRKMFVGTFGEWNEHNLKVLNSYQLSLTGESLIALKRFEYSRKCNFLKRIYLLKKAGVYRQSALDNIALVLAASIGRI